jgi:hypothetical protein
MVKVRLEYTVDVDPEDWVRAFGVAREDVRDDVRDYMRNLIQQCAAAEETGLEIV